MQQSEVNDLGGSKPDEQEGLNSERFGRNVLRHKPITYLHFILGVKFVAIEIDKNPECNDSLVTLDVMYPANFANHLMEDDSPVERAQYLVADEIEFSGARKPIFSHITGIKKSKEDSQEVTLRLTLRIVRDQLHQIQHNAFKGNFDCIFHLGVKSRTFSMK